MAAQILRKKLSELEAKLQQRKVSFEMTDEAFSCLLKKGFTKEYGAREMDRVIARELKPLFMNIGQYHSIVCQSRKLYQGKMPLL